MKRPEILSDGYDDVTQYAIALNNYIDHLEKEKEKPKTCGNFINDGLTSSATKCICGCEKWEHPN